jgi:hypothetical protein
LSEIAPTYWRRIAGVEQPTPEQVLSTLVLLASWSSADDENIDTFDFGLPEGVSNYLLSVRFRADGQVADVAMES